MIRIKALERKLAIVRIILVENYQQNNRKKHFQHILIPEYYKVQTEWLLIISILIAWKKNWTNQVTKNNCTLHMVNFQSNEIMFDSINKDPLNIRKAEEWDHFG